MVEGNLDSILNPLLYSYTGTNSLPCMYTCGRSVVGNIHVKSSLGCARVIVCVVALEPGGRNAATDLLGVVVIEATEVVIYTIASAKGCTTATTECA